MIKADTPLKEALAELQLTWILENHDVELADAARKNRTGDELLLRLLRGEVDARHARSIDRRIREAKIKSARRLDDFDFSWPTEINRDHVRHIFTMGFLREKANVVFIGGVGLGKTHLAAALAREACFRRLPVLFTSAIDIVNNLVEAAARNALSSAIRRYAYPKLLVVDELGYLPLDKVGAEMLFQVFCARYEQASTIITTNRAYRDWSQTFANDLTITSAVLDRINHHCETVIIKGKSYRTKDVINE
ncbi:MAG: ATP-binding protein [Lentisphaerae bacterium]|nr:ATP-binding protein [Lentisphaerota bacterium]